MNHPYRARPIAETHNWLTPPELLILLGEFDLDPCAVPEPRPWRTARQHIAPPNDGLTEPWKGRVWCNPPFGSQTVHWLERMALHNNGIALAFARTDTTMFRKSVWPVAAAVLFLSGRPHFHRPDGERAPGNSGGPICLIAYGEENARSLAASGIKGALVRVQRWGG